ncbi:hypothetical protein [Hymenobacter psychrotolerans]|uniref:Uncharacterized protein n=1 Tax=Hymenobacter psychrotolerans DSM 18569 TaxID=1121959 RepID=A0A1M6WII2_9BACT|nr:hypothetical protein [Hymenobacter psychrotolerans]SHK93444.1 hypothetical protein SAMN02746009_01802 [Hymenobacter psychrotolerans DSM 18569]
MQNDLIEARLRRDTTLSAFLDQARPRYEDTEPDVAPLRTALAADQDRNPARKRGVRGQLTALLQRLSRALTAHAKSTANPELAARVPRRLSDLSRLSETSFAEQARLLLDLGQPHAKDLARRHYTAAHHTQAESLLSDFQTQRTEGRLADTSGSTGREALERLIKANARLVADLEDYFALYKEDEPDLWNEFRAAAKVVHRGGGSGGEKL